MFSPSWTFLPLPSLSHPLGSSQCTSPEHPVSCIEPGLAIYFTYDKMNVSMLFSQIILGFSLSSFILSSVQFSCSVMSNSLWSRGLQHARPSWPSPTPRVYSNSCPLSLWCHPAISSSVISFSSHLQSFLASGSFQMSQFFASGGQTIRVSASAPSNEYAGLISFSCISLQSKGLSRVFSNTTIQKHQLFGTQLSSQSNSHINTWLLEKP